ncbi:MAG: pilus assembly protein [Rhodospirillaceae bacterium]|nr:pilus assembly protein [Rhodospirillaceae bacterium]
MFPHFGRHVCAGLRRFRTERKGTAVAEFAIAAPMLLLLLSGMLDLGMALNQSSSLSSAARAGAQYAMRFPGDSDGIKKVVTAALEGDASQATITSTLTCECSDGTKTACSEPCSGSAPKFYVAVSVSMPFLSPLPTAMMLGIGTVSGSAIFRAN